MVNILLRISCVAFWIVPINVYLIYYQYLQKTSHFRLDIKVDLERM